MQGRARRFARRKTTGKLGRRQGAAAQTQSPRVGRIGAGSGTLRQRECASLSPDDAEGSRDEKLFHCPAFGARCAHWAHSIPPVPDQSVAKVVGLADDLRTERIGLRTHSTFYA